VVSAIPVTMGWPRKMVPAESLPRRSLLLSITCHGVCFGVRVNSRAMWNLVVQRTSDLVPRAVVNGPGRIRWLYSLEEQGVNSAVIVHSGRRKLAVARSRAAAFEWMCSDLQMKLAEMTDEFVFIHAGVVGWQGRAIVIPGRSFSGKSTLVAELLRRGASYYSDEYAVFSPSGAVHAFPCPLHLRSRTGAHGRRIPAHQLPAGIGGEPLPAGLFLFLSYRRDHGWRARRLSPGQGVLALLRNAIAARRRPSETLRTLRLAVLNAPAIRGFRGEASAAADKVFELFSESWTA
jgi:hypothetical protein